MTCKYEGLGRLRPKQDVVLGRFSASLLTSGCRSSRDKKGGGHG